MSSVAKKRRWAYTNQRELLSPITDTFIDFAFKQFKHFYCVLNGIEFDNPSPTAFSEMIVKVSKATSIEHLLQAYYGLSFTFATEADEAEKKYDGLCCTLCANTFDRTGKFAYSHSEIASFKEKSHEKPNQTAKFRNLKASIRSHLLSEAHGNKTGNDHGEIASNADLMNKIEEMMTFMESSRKESPTTLASSDMKSIKTEESKRLSRAKSVPEIMEVCKHLKLHFESEQAEAKNEFIGIQCSPCYSISLSKLKSNKETSEPSKKIFGLFHFHHSKGTSFAGKQQQEPNQPQKFGQLKDSISTHLSSKAHLKVVNEKHELSQSEIEFQKQNHDIGVTLGTVALKSFVSYQSKASYEREVAFLSDIGVKVGDINHGKDFADSLCLHLYNTLKDQAVLVLNNRILPQFDASPFIVFADKLTPFAKTLQVIGVIMLQEMCNTAIVLEIMEVDHLVQNGKALAQDIVKTLYKFYTPEAAKKLYVGCSFDGQYHKLNVPTEILSQLGIQFNSLLSKEQLAQEQFHTYSWDPAHLIELACGDVKKSKKFEWVEKVEQSIVTINKGNTYGKNFLKLMEEAHLIQSILLRPSSFSDTRFCAYKYRVLYRFWNNYASLFNKLCRDGDDDLNCINNMQFCLRLCGLLDTFKLVGALSRRIQSSKIYPWECDSAIEETIQNLRSMAQSLGTSQFVPNNTHLKYFNEGLDEIMSKGSFKEKGVYFKQQVVYLTRSKSACNSEVRSFDCVKNRVMKELHNYITAIADSIEERYSKNHSQHSFIFARDSFSLDKIIDRPNLTPPNSFKEYCRMAKLGGFMEDVSQDILDSEYTQFAQQVKSIYFSYLNNGSAVPESRLFWEVLKSEKIKDCKHVVSLLTSAVVRNKSECIAESIGNLIKQHLVHRCGLLNENLSMEIFLRFNGPTPNRNAKELVEKALTKRFEGNDWHLIRRSSKTGLKQYETSKVVDKQHQSTSRIGFVLEDNQTAESDEETDV